MKKIDYDEEAKDLVTRIPDEGPSIIAKALSRFFHRGRSSVERDAIVRTRDRVRSSRNLLDGVETLLRRIRKKLDEIDPAAFAQRMREVEDEMRYDELEKLGAEVRRLDDWHCAHCGGRIITSLKDAVPGGEKP